MKLIGLMLVRNEEWCIEACLKRALEWCDGVAILLDRCTDGTQSIVENVIRPRLSGADYMVRVDDGKSVHWNEMDQRQRNFEDGRALGGTHFAIIDADEILTANLVPVMKVWFTHLADGQLLDLPMVPVWDDLGHARDDDSVWTRARLTVGFKDSKAVTGWRAAADG